jgi:hypothetical protein
LSRFIRFIINGVGEIMSPKPKRGRPPKYVNGPDGKPIVGMSFDKHTNQYYLTHSNPRIYLGSNYENALFKFNQIEKKKTVYHIIDSDKIKQGTRITLYPDGEITPRKGESHESVLKRIEEADKMMRRRLEEDPDGLEKRLILDEKLIPEEFIWDRARKLILSDHIEASKKLGIPQIAYLENLEPLKPSVTLENIGKLYFERKIKPLGIDELQDSRRWWKQFCDIVRVKTIREVTLKQINKYQNKIHEIVADNNFSPTYIKHRFDKVKTILNYSTKVVENSGEITKVLEHCKKFIYQDKAKVNPNLIN